ncbi:hypothetical protein [Psychromicrobium lacuslunae]|uniref:Lipoprotein n=1 Tax=Psychromicrobium lacuslunae TaxID=1618207 RepID=A0A0D4C219_9MICC|nr:hypothetical protein [Psychromicrobium lacuslunae]AJT42460.1 hypothetical protein UM93_14900 [Psychromicrobium lacuslunae]
MKRTAAVIALAASSILLLSACNAGVNGNENDKQETKTFATAKDGAGVLPSWIPDGATDIKEVLRTTGSERIISMKNVKLPASCQALPAGQKPTPADDTDSNVKAADFVTDGATLKAAWWPNGTEQKAKSRCGKWWVTVDGDTTFAFSPELKTVMKNINGGKKIGNSLELGLETQLEKLSE